jgi:hypothetical protein
MYEEMIVTNELISMNHLEDQLTVQDDPGVWKEILAVLGEEFLQRYRAEQGEADCKSRPHHLRSCVRSVRRYLVPAAPQPSSLSIVIQSNSNAPTESSGCNGTENPCGEQPRQFGNIASDTFTPPGMFAYSAEGQLERIYRVGPHLPAAPLGQMTSGTLGLFSPPRERISEIN